MSTATIARAGRRCNIHRELELESPWTYQAAVAVRAYVPEDGDGRPEQVRGRANLTLQSGAFSLSLRPNSADLRALAAILLATADDNDGTEVA